MLQRWFSSLKNDEDTNLERQNLILFMMESELFSSFIDNNSIGMDLLNRFVAEENDQFEVCGFYRLKTAEDEVRVKSPHINIIFMNNI